MSKYCVATSVSEQHDFEPGTAAEIRRLSADLWEVCGQKRGYFRHKASCAEGCGRVAAKESVGGYCCKACVRSGNHTEKCDEREAPR